MRTTKRPAWTITPGTRTLIDGEEREVFSVRDSFDGSGVIVSAKVTGGTTSFYRDRLAPVVIVLDHHWYRDADGTVRHEEAA